MSLQAYKENLEKIVSAISSEKVLLISPAPVDEARQHNRTKEVLGQYADVVEEVAKETGSHFLNLYAEMIQEQHFELPPLNTLTSCLKWRIPTNTKVSLSYMSRLSP